MSISSSRLDFEDSVFDGEDRDIESSTSKIEDKDITFSLSLLIKSVSDSCGSGLIDDTENVQSSDGSGVLGSLTLGIVEVSWDSNNGILE